MSYNIIVYIHSKWEEWGSTLEMCVYVRVGARKVRVLFQFSGLFWIIFCRNWKAHCIQSAMWCLSRFNFSLFQYFDIDYATHSVWKMLVKDGIAKIQHYLIFFSRCCRRCFSWSTRSSFLPLSVVVIAVHDSYVFVVQYTKSSWFKESDFEILKITI